MKHLAIITIMIFLFIPSCIDSTLKTATTNRNYAADFKQMKWLIGTWKGEYEGKPFYEAWRMANDTLMVNYFIEINGQDTVVKEGSPLNVHSNDIHLGLKDSVNWKLESLTDKEITLKNDTLQYSNHITWRNTTDGHWYTILKHPKSTVTFDLVKIPELDNVVNRFVESKQ